MQTAMNDYITEQLNGEDAGAIEKACALLRSGELVAFPTETVYGLGGDALNPDASAKIYAAKGRPSDNPLIVHIAQISAIDELADTSLLAPEMQEKTQHLLEAFWPGPLTVILPKRDIVPKATTGGLDTVAIRMPSHPVAMELIKKSGVYIAAPSANASGRPSPTTAEHVMQDLSSRIPLILDGGAVGIGIESTIVDMTGDVPTILRPGFITKKMLEQMIGEVMIDPALIEPDANLRPKAPGMKYTHYAPQGELTIVEMGRGDGSFVSGGHGDGSFVPENHGDKRTVPTSPVSPVTDAINALCKEKEAQGFKVCVLATEEHASAYTCPQVITVGNEADGATVAARLYAALRECDAIGAQYIYSEAFDGTELSGAIMNRLIKAAGHRVIVV